MPAKRRVCFPSSIEDDPEVKQLLAKSVLQPGFDSKPVEEVTLKSKRRMKKERKAERAMTAGPNWFNMPATEMTDEIKMDLEIMQMRNSLDSKTFYRKNDRAVLPKYFQIGTIVDTAADKYSRVTKKQKKRTMVEELMQDYQLLEKHKRKYDDIRARKAKIRKNKGFQNMRTSKNKMRAMKKAK